MRPAARALSYEFVPLNRARRVQRNAFARLLRLAGDSPWLGYPAAVLAVPPLLVLGWLGNLATQRRRGQIPERPISSAIVVMEIDARLAAQAEEFTPREPGSRRPRAVRPAFAGAGGAPLAAPDRASSLAIKGVPSMAQSFSAADAETREPQYQRCLELQAEQGLTSLGLMTSQVWEDDPRRLTFLLARYKFVAKMLSGRKSVAELGCGDAFGSRIVMQEVEHVTTYDFDTVFIDDIKARRSARWPVEAHFHDILLDKLPHHYDGLYSLDVIEQLIPLAGEAGLSLTHMAMAFVMAHPGVTSAILGPRTMPHLDDLLAGAEVRLSDEVLDRIDQIVPPGTDVGLNGAAYIPPAILKADLRRRPGADRAAA